MKRRARGAGSERTDSGRYVDFWGLKWATATVEMRSSRHVRMGPLWDCTAQGSNGSGDGASFARTHQSMRRTILRFIFVELANTFRIYFDRSQVISIIHVESFLG